MGASRRIKRSYQLEKILLSASIKSRDSYELIRNHINVKRYSREFGILFERIGEYYRLDPSAKSGQRDVILAVLADKVKAEKHVQRITEILDLAIAEAVDLSEANVSFIVLQAKQQEIGDELAAAITNGKPTDELLEQYSRIIKLGSLEELHETGIEIYSTDDLASIIHASFSGEGLLKVYPESLAERLDGGLRGGHHLVLFARPETGKSADCITLAGGFARHGHRVLYWTNEDRPQDILLRLTSCLTGRSKQEVLGDIAGSMELARARGLDLIQVVSAAPGTPKQIEAYIDKTRPAAVIIDQLRNVDMGGRDGNRVIQLEQAATFARNMAKKYNIVVISVTQAGDSASGKASLEMGDVDFSNTGIPAQADVMLGIGMDSSMENTGVRVFSLPKNKITGRHESWPVKLIPMYSRYTSI